MTIFVAANDVTATNASLLAALLRRGASAEWLPASSLLERPRPGDTVLARFDALPPVDSADPGVWELPQLERGGVVLLNGRPALLAALDRLATVLALARAGLPHPATGYIAPGERFGVSVPTIPAGAPLVPPLVVRPRFGGSDRDAVACDTTRQLARLLRGRRPRWLVRDGALVQTPLPPAAPRLRAIVVNGRVLWADEPRPPGGPLECCGPTRVAAGELAAAAAAAVGADLVAVDLLVGERELVVLGLDAAFELPASAGEDLFDELAGEVLGLLDRRVASPGPDGRLTASTVGV
jgi:glutathione synthase/RimK-type ligase-like ATP-grasp enzyme